MSHQELIAVWDARLDKIMDDFTNEITIFLRKRETNQKVEKRTQKKI
jgi:hypothetical protein